MFSVRNPLATRFLLSSLFTNKNNCRDDDLFIVKKCIRFCLQKNIPENKNKGKLKIGYISKLHVAVRVVPFVTIEIESADL